MSMGVPTLSLDHRGMHDTIDSHNGIKIPILSYKQTVKGIANQLMNIINNPEIDRQIIDAGFLLNENNRIKVIGSPLESQSLRKLIEKKLYE
jgi:hypothetical protein